MAYKQIRHAVAIWGTLLVGAGHTAGSILFGQLKDTNLYREAADHLKTDDAFSIGGSAGIVGDVVGNASVQGNPLNTQGGSALTANGQIGFDGSLLYGRTGGSIFSYTPSGSIAI